MDLFSNQRGSQVRRPWSGQLGGERLGDKRRLMGNLNNKMIIKMQPSDAKPLRGLRPKGNSLCYDRQSFVISEFDSRTQYCRLHVTLVRRAGLWCRVVGVSDVPQWSLGQLTDFHKIRSLQPASHSRATSGSNTCVVLLTPLRETST
jgi:hypothetical protein